MSKEFPYILYSSYGLYIPHTVLIILDQITIRGQSIDFIIMCSLIMYSPCFKVMKEMAGDCIFEVFNLIHEKLQHL